ncbi:MAG TPA: glycosyltransferase [Candidatus Omnitrophota bacterium]|nr:glycosyltransferase [Candidatus Omnitrophota bacterium]HQO58858.1 glycosyltransferase [Candidatus Omnitrophota bacterium]
MVAKTKMADSQISICFLPGRESSYARTRVILKSLQTVEGLKVYDCSCAFKSKLRYFLSFFQFLKYKNKSDLIFVGFLGQFLIPFVKVCTRKKIILDAFLSIYQTMVYDRKVFAAGSVLARLARFCDRMACRLADIVILDTDQHIQYFQKEYHFDKRHFVKVLVGSDTSVMHPRDDIAEEKGFLVHFHGEYQPLHGAIYIVKAAAFLPDIKFQMIGKGREYLQCVQLAQELHLKNITFLPPVPYEELSQHMARASVCLGIFGDTPKTQMVIPHKVYEAIAMKKAVITAETAAAMELLEHKKDVFFCKPENPRSLADAVLELRGNPELRNRIAENGYLTFEKHCSENKIGQILKGIISSLHSHEN